MAYRDGLEVVSQWAAILTAAVAVWAYAVYRCERYRKRKKLETYLKREKAVGKDKGQRSILHLVARLRMSEADVMNAAFRSKHVSCLVAPDFSNRAGMLLLEYAADDPD
ncbi:hypothetical protein V6C03_00615 [Methyloligella sp. 2.7D]|uniref:hypothetical protein n=1 Tax=unclassified Methyloligella TaxID=2625955 RepID=UPI00157C507D|nr:hypothetical protein [Methyloligella sp. GL2]QKP76826.1 hypothetical protein HT051_04800 [Methyloligella sp. GL2]